MKTHRRAITEYDNQQAIPKQIIEGVESGKWLPELKLHYNKGKVVSAIYRWEFGAYKPVLLLLRV